MKIGRIPDLMPDIKIATLLEKNINAPEDEAHFISSRGVSSAMNLFHRRNYKPRGLHK